MVEELGTGRLLPTAIEPVTRADLKALGGGWKFDWLGAAKQGEVFKLVAEEALGQILGLLCLVPRDDHIEVALIECSPGNIGQGKRFDGIAGNLLAFAAEFSGSLGHDGVICLMAKTRLIGHYRDVYGFARIGNSQKMFLDPATAARLIGIYRGN